MSTEKKKTGILFICLGNICRSPMAEAIFLDLVKQRNLEDQFEVDSAAIGPWHLGKGPEKRCTATLKKHGIQYTHQVRQIKSVDHSKFDYIFGMDHENISDIQDAGSGSARIELLGKYDPENELIIVDPYYTVDLAAGPALMNQSPLLVVYMEAGFTSKEGWFCRNLGNRCRSPLSEAIFKHLLKQKGISKDKVFVDSAAVVDYWVGHEPDPRTIACLNSNGISDYSHTIRQVSSKDHREFDFILTVDRSTFQDARGISQLSEGKKAQVFLIGSFDPAGHTDISDPKNDHGPEEFDAMYQQITRCLTIFLNQKLMPML